MSPRYLTSSTCSRTELYNRKHSRRPDSQGKKRSLTIDLSGTLESDCDGYAVRWFDDQQFSLDQRPNSFEDDDEKYIIGSPLTKPEIFLKNLS